MSADKYRPPPPRFAAVLIAIGLLAAGVLVILLFRDWQRLKEIKEVGPGSHK